MFITDVINGHAFDLSKIGYIAFFKNKDKEKSGKTYSLTLGGITPYNNISEDAIKRLRASIQEYNKASGNYYSLYDNIFIDLTRIQHFEISSDCSELKFHIDGHIHTIVRGENSSLQKGFHQLVAALKMKAATTKKREAPVEDDEEEKPKDSGYKVSDEKLEGLLRQYSRDFTREAREGTLSPYIDHENLLEKLRVTLLRRDRGNAIITGEAGTGKSALVEGLAQLIADGKAGKAFEGARIICLNMTSMDNTKWKGEFEGKLFPILDGIVERNKDGQKIILFFDEAHAQFKAGAADGIPPVKEHLKPYLTNPYFRSISATTEDEYLKDFSMDSAIERRHERIAIPVPDAAKTLSILRGRRVAIENLTGIAIPDAVLDKVISLTDRYLPHLHQPDKSLDRLYKACASVELREGQRIEIADIEKSVAELANISVDFISGSEAARYETLEHDIGKSIFGQDENLAAIGETLRKAQARLNDQRKPLGSFLLAGPTGTGKTETLKQIAKQIHGTEDALIRIDMGNYTDPYAVMRLIGNERQLGDLTKAIAKRPYAVLALDEIEKAHPDVLSLLLQILEEGQITDGRGKKVSFKNVVVGVMTNEGADILNKKTMGFGADAKLAREEMIKACRDALLKSGTFRDEFINRFDKLLVYGPLDQVAIGKCYERELSELSKNLRKEWNAAVEISPDLHSQILKDGYDPRYNARAIKRTFNDLVTSPLSSWLPGQRQKGELPESARIRISRNNVIALAA